MARGKPGVSNGAGLDNAQSNGTAPGFPRYRARNSGACLPGIARRVELFNQALRLAWPHLSQEEIKRPNASRFLSDAIQRRLKLGATDPALIAAEAVVEVRARI